MDYLDCYSGKIINKYYSGNKFKQLIDIPGYFGGAFYLGICVYIFIKFIEAGVYADLKFLFLFLFSLSSFILGIYGLLIISLPIVIIQICTMLMIFLLFIIKIIYICKLNYYNIKNSCIYCIEKELY